jgi:thiamine-phosphate pyrophosphorylase
MRVEPTPAVIRALQTAQEWATFLDAREVQLAHLLLGLVQEEEGRPALLLAGAGLERSRIHNLLAAGQAASPPPLPETTQPQGSALDDLLRDARRLARHEFGDTTVTSEHLLLALLRADDALRESLEGQGLSFARLEATMLAAQGPPLELDEPLHLDKPADQIDTARILDAAANRAREALRVVEDYCRFVLDDRFLSGELKRLRHDLAEALSDLPPHLLLQGRETLRDVGTTLTTAREQERQSLPDVVQANLKRLQEALRSLEEYGKLHGANVGQAVEGLRYRTYTLERALLLGTTARARLADARLYVLVTADQCALGLTRTIREACDGGAQIIQLREKGLPDRELLARARMVRSLTREGGVLFIVNDRPDIARLAEADGVHVGQDELPVKHVRRIVGPDALIGVSTHNLDQVRQAVLDGASYIGVGPTFPSSTKPFADFPGLDFVRQATAETSLPAFVIGGVALQNLGAALDAGATRVAVSHAICQSDAPAAIAAAMQRALAPG